MVTSPFSRVIWLGLFGVPWVICVSMGGEVIVHIYGMCMFLICGSTYHKLEMARGAGIARGLRLARMVL